MVNLEPMHTDLKMSGDVADSTDTRGSLSQVEPGNDRNGLDFNRQTREIPTSSRQIMEESRRDTDAVVKADFLKKCKEAGLLNELFEELLDKLYLVQAKLMDNNTSESEYEDIGTSLFDCGFFEDTILNFAAAIEKKINKSEERQQQLKKEIELLKGLKQSLCYSPDNTDLMSCSTSMSSLSS